MKWLVCWESSGQMVVDADTEEEAKDCILTMNEDELHFHDTEFEIEAHRMTEE